MPSAEPPTVVTWRFYVVLAAALALIGYWAPAVLAVLGGVGMACSIGTLADDRRLASLAARREGESICTFVRAFDYRAVDTWILRAVYEELQTYGRFRGGVLPLRRTDDLEHTLGIDPEDLGDSAYTIATRAGRSMDGCEVNPLWGRVNTVGDLVQFLMAQPSTRGA
jgi:hypothetical protein